MRNETLELLQKLRTIHWDFNGRKVSDEDLHKIIEHGMRAANATNLANYLVIVVDDTDVIKQLVNNTGKARCLVFCIDFTRIVQAANYLGYDYKANGNWYSLFTSLYDVFAVAQTAVIAAKSMGIDSLVTNGLYRADIKEVKKILKLPEKHCFPVMAVLLGYSDKPETEVTGRLSENYVTHFGEYKMADEGAIKEIVDEFDKIYPEYISEQFKHTLDWYYNVWLTSYSGVASDKDIRLHEALKESGFDL